LSTAFSLNIYLVLVLFIDRENGNRKGKHRDRRLFRESLMVLQILEVSRNKSRKKIE